MIVMTDPTGTSSPSNNAEIVSPLSALSWARVLLFAKQHGVVAALCLLMAYQIGLMASAQQYLCGV